MINYVRQLILIWGYNLIMFLAEEGNGFGQEKWPQISQYVDAAKVK